MIINGILVEENLYDEFWVILVVRNIVEFIMEIIVYVIINLMVLLGNIFVCVIFYKNLNLWSVIYLYIFVFVILDVFMVVFCMFFVWGVLLVGEWRYGGVVCGFYGFVVFFLVFVLL